MKKRFGRMTGSAVGRGYVEYASECGSRRDQPDFNGEGYREITDVAEGSREDKDSWSNFLRYLKERGLKGARLIIEAETDCKFCRNQRGGDIILYGFPV